MLKHLWRHNELFLFSFFLLKTRKCSWLNRKESKLAPEMGRKICKFRIFWWATCEFINSHHSKSASDDKLENGFFVWCFYGSICAVVVEFMEIVTRHFFFGWGKTLICQSLLMTHSGIEIGFDSMESDGIDLNFTNRIICVGFYFFRGWQEKKLIFLGRGENRGKFFLSQEKFQVKITLMPWAVIELNSRRFIFLVIKLLLLSIQKNTNSRASERKKNYSSVGKQARCVNWILS